MIFADISLAFEPVWPWTYPLLGPIALTGVAFLLTSLTVWTYLGVKQATRRRVMLIIALRLAALALTVCLVVRPSFSMTQLEGVELTKLLAIFDRSESMNAANAEGTSSRWQHVNQLWGSPDVQRRLDRLLAEQKIEVVKYHAAEELRPYDASAEAAGKRTDIGVWLDQLMQRHGQEKHLRGVVLFSDGADNGTKFSAQEKARAWRGVASIHPFGVGNPNDARFKKDIGLTSVRVAGDKPIPIKSKFAIKAVAQAPGFDQTDVEVTVTMQALDADAAPHKAAYEQRYRVRQEKDQRIDFPHAVAPDVAGEYKLTVRVTPTPDEANKENNEISTFVQVIKEKINVLWVDRPRVYEPTLAIRLALAPEERFDVRFVMPPLKSTRDPFEFYEIDQRKYDVIVIGDISADRFCLGKPEFFDKLKKMVTKDRTGLLMLGGTETLARGGWNEILSLLPVKLDAAKPDYIETRVQVMPTKEGKSYSFLRLVPDEKKNDEFWQNDFGPLLGYSPLGAKTAGSEVLLTTDTNENALVVTQAGAGRTAVFAGNSTAKAWLGTPEAVQGYQRFWKQLVYWLAQDQDQQNQLWVSLDKRRVNLDIDEPLGFTFGWRDKDNNEVPNAVFDVKVFHGETEHPTRFVREESLRQYRGTFQGAKNTGEHRLVIKATSKGAKDAPEPKTARFLVVSEDLEMLRPVAEHDTLMRIADASEGRFRLAEETALLQYLDELKTHVNNESRHKTTHWPDWKRLPATADAREQIAGLWQSFALVALLIFVALLGTEWLLRRTWGMV